MKLAEYVQGEVTRRNKFKTTILKALAKKSGVSYMTLTIVERGGKMVHYDKAKCVSQATGGAVTVEELCE
jgi:hypothetical protein